MKWIIFLQVQSVAPPSAFGVKFYKCAKVHQHNNLNTAIFIHVHLIPTYFSGLILNYKWTCQQPSSDSFSSCSILKTFLFLSEFSDFVKTKNSGLLKNILVLWNDSCPSTQIILPVSFLCCWLLQIRFLGHESQLGCPFFYLFISN